MGAAAVLEGGTCVGTCVSVISAVTDRCTGLSVGSARLELDHQLSSKKLATYITDVAVTVTRP